MQEKEISAILRIEGGTADDGILDIYDAANTMYGLARGINLVAHAFANDEEVKYKAKTAKGSQAFIHSSLKGCFEEKIDIIFNPKVCTKIGNSVIANNFWDYLLWCWSAATGLTYNPQTPHTKRIIKGDPDFILEIADTLESPMQYIHKSILRNNSVKIYLSRPRIGDQLIFNERTLSFVTTRNESSTRETIEGNVTRYNVLSDFGRLYSNNEGRVISFKLAETKTERIQQLVIQSMKDKVSGREGKLFFTVSQVISGQGHVKRYIVHDVQAR